MEQPDKRARGKRPAAGQNPTIPAVHPVSSLQGSRDRLVRIGGTRRGRQGMCPPLFGDPCIRITADRRPRVRVLATAQSYGFGIRWAMHHARIAPVCASPCSAQCTVPCQHDHPATRRSSSADFFNANYRDPPTWQPPRVRVSVIRPRAALAWIFLELAPRPARQNKSRAANRRAGRWVTGFKEGRKGGARVCWLSWS